MLDFHEENLKPWHLQYQLRQARKQVKALGNPKEIQRRNRLTILQWLYRWGFSTADILSDLLGRANRSHARRLADDGWMRAVSIKGYPTYYVLTERGLAEAIHHSSELFEYKESDPYRVHLPTLHHYLVAQAETITAIKNGWFSDYRTERMSRFDKNNHPLKVPDVIFVSQVESEFQGMVDQYIGVEIELTGKWKRNLDLFITNIIDDLQNSRFRLFVIISDSQAILDRYREAFQPGKKVKIWKKLPGGKFADTGEILVTPNWSPEYVLFRSIGSALPYPAVK